MEIGVGPLSGRYDTVVCLSDFETDDLLCLRMLARMTSHLASLLTTAGGGALGGLAPGVAGGARGLVSLLTPSALLLFLSPGLLRLHPMSPHLGERREHARVRSTLSSPALICLAVLAFS